MKKNDLQGSSEVELVERFAAIGIEQDDALLHGEISKFNRLFRQMVAIENELRRRPEDRRKDLLSLFVHPNMQVRLDAAKATLAVAPDAARQMLQAIAESHWQPQAGDAGMCLWNLDRGVFVPT